MKGFMLSICLLTMQFTVCGCRPESESKAAMIPRPNLPPQSLGNISTDSIREKSEVAKKRLLELGARITQQPYWNPSYTSVDLNAGWEGKSEDLRLLKDLYELEELYLSPTTTKEAFQYLYVLKEIKLISVSATKLSKSEIALLRRKMPKVRIVKDTEVEGFIPIPDLAE